MNPQLRNVLVPHSWREDLPERLSVMVNLIALGYIYYVAAFLSTAVFSDKNGYTMVALIAAIASWLFRFVLRQSLPKPERTPQSNVFLTLSALAIFYALGMDFMSGFGSSL